MLNCLENINRTCKVLYNNTNAAGSPGMVRPSPSSGPNIGDNWAFLRKTEGVEPENGESAVAVYNKE